MKSESDPPDTAKVPNGDHLVNCNTGGDYMTSAIAFDSDIKPFDPPSLTGWRVALAKIASVYVGKVLRQSADNIHQTALKLIGIRQLIAHDVYGSNLFDPTGRYISALQKSLDDTKNFNAQINNKRIKNQKLKDDFLYFSNHFSLYEKVVNLLIADIRQHDTKIKYKNPHSSKTQCPGDSSFNEILRSRLEEAQKNPKIGLEIMESCGIINKNGEVTKDFGGHS